MLAALAHDRSHTFGGSTPCAIFQRADEELLRWKVVVERCRFHRRPTRDITHHQIAARYLLGQLPPRYAFEFERFCRENPKFVEDMVRDVAARLNDDDRIAAYVVESENFESIHNHSAYALIERDKTAG